MMLGLALCWFCIDLTQGEGRRPAPIVCMWILAVPLLDMSGVMLVRTRRKVSMFDADRQHLHHLLLARGVSPHAAALVMIGISELTGGLAIAAWQVGVPEAVFTYAFIATFLLVLFTAHLKERREIAS
jgi:UDP-GlcNAc:undecaprenyl-phosphate GlcNAc-1-phosphate transferase